MLCRYFVCARMQRSHSDCCGRPTSGVNGLSSSSSVERAGCSLHFLYSYLFFPCLHQSHTECCGRPRTGVNGLPGSRSVETAGDFLQCSRQNKPCRKQQHGCYVVFAPTSFLLSAATSFYLLTPAGCLAFKFVLPFFPQRWITGHGNIT